MNVTGVRGCECDLMCSTLSIVSVSTKMEGVYPTWVMGSVTGSPFTIKGTVLYPTERVLYPSNPQQYC